MKEAAVAAGGTRCYTLGAARGWRGMERLAAPSWEKRSEKRELGTAAACDGVVAAEEENKQKEEQGNRKEEKEKRKKERKERKKEKEKRKKIVFGFLFFSFFFLIANSIYKI